MHPDLRYLDMWADEKIHIVKPKSSGVRTIDGPMAQADLIAREAPSLCEELGCNLVIWDTATITVRACTEELAKSGIHKTSTTKKYTVTDSAGETVTNRVTPDRRDYFMSQTHLREAVRNQMLLDPNRNFHLIHVLHQETAKKSAGKDSGGEPVYMATMHGPNGGGPGSVEAWGTEYRALNRIYVDQKGNHVLQLQEMADKQGVPFAARTNTGTKTPSTINIPDTFDKSVETWQQILKWMGIFPEDPRKGGYYSATLYGLMGSGKTRWASTLAGVPGVTGLLYIAADGDSEYLGSFWNELKGLA